MTILTHEVLTESGPFIDFVNLPKLFPENDTFWPDPKLAFKKNIRSMIQP